MICPYCSVKHEAHRQKVQCEYKGTDLEYEGVFYTCSVSGKHFADVDANDIALKDAYRVKNGMLTARMLSEIRNRYKTEDLRAILGNEEKNVFERGGHHVQSKEYDIAIRMLDQMLQMSMHQ